MQHGRRGVRDGDIDLQCQWLAVDIGPCCRMPHEYGLFEVGLLYYNF